MEFEYSFIDKEPYFIMEIAPNENIKGCIGNISNWLSSDVQCFGKRYLARVKEILESSDLNEKEIFWGNAFETLVCKEVTTIKYTYEEENPHMVPCTLPTEMLCEILEVWIKAYEEHREKTKKKEE